MGRASALAALAALGVAIYLVRETPREPRGPRVRRIVSLIPSHTELVFAAGAGDLLVGVSKYCDWPPEAASIPKVGDVSVDEETLVRSNPDLVYSSRSMLGRTNASLASRGLRVRESDPDSWESIAAEIRWIALETGRDPSAGDRLLDRVRTIPKLPRALRIAYVQPGLLAAGRGTTADLVIRTIGGVNAIDADGWAWIDRETLLRANADVILVPRGAPDGIEVGPEIERPTPRLAEVAEWLSWRLR